MTLPLIAIVGRTNVGKSRLFNRLTGKFKALVDDTAGVTRDRHYGYADWRGKSFLVVDTGGLIPGSETPLNQKVWQQAFLAIAEADLLICLFDGQEGLTPVDEALVAKLRRVAKPKIYVVNKIDAAAHEKMLFDFARLGVESLIGVSAEHGRGVSDLLDALHEQLGSPPQVSDTWKGAEALRLAIVGRPNVGKSTLLNQLAKAERVIVDEQAGTTRDAIDVLIQRGESRYVFVDTAGIKRKKLTQGRLEKFSVLNALKAIDNSQIALFLLDAIEGLTHQDLHLAYHIWNSNKGLIFLINKWDLVSLSTAQYIKILSPQLGELQTVPILCISAKTSKGCGAIWPALKQMERQWGRRVETSQLNEWLEEMTTEHPPPLYQGRTVRIYYGTQVTTAPPHIVLFCNEPKGLKPAYQRYLKNELSRRLDLEGIPIRLTLRRRGGRR